MVTVMSEKGWVDLLFIPFAIFCLATVVLLIYKFDKSKTFDDGFWGSVAQFFTMLLTLMVAVALWGVIRESFGNKGWLKFPDRYYVADVIKEQDATGAYRFSCPEGFEKYNLSKSEVPGFRCRKPFPWDYQR